MARKAARGEADCNKTLHSVRCRCVACGSRMWADYDNRRTVVTLEQTIRLTLKVRRCHNNSCSRYLKPYRPEAEGRYALPQHEFGLDVIALVGALRYREHLTVPEMAVRLVEQHGLKICERSVTNLLDRYDELLAVSLSDEQRLRSLLSGQGRVILALDGLQPDVGHEVLWVLRDCISGEVLLARSLLSEREADLVELIKTVTSQLGVPIEGVVSDGQHSIRNAVRSALPKSRPRDGKKGLPRELEKLKKRVDRGLDETASHWPSIQRAFLLGSPSRRDPRQLRTNVWSGSASSTQRSAGRDVASSRTGRGTVSCRRPLRQSLAQLLARLISLL